MSLIKFRDEWLMRRAALAFVPGKGWTLGARLRMIRHWDHYFSKDLCGNDQYAPTLEDGTEGYVVMSCLGVRARGEWTAQLHFFLRIDPREPFHTHQADLGVRIILFGGYDEEVVREDGSIERVEWRKGDIGIIPAALDHRMVAVQPEGATSLWVRGKTKNPVRWTFPSGFFKVLALEDMD